MNLRQKGATAAELSKTGPHIGIRPPRERKTMIRSRQKGGCERLQFESSGHERADGARLPKNTWPQESQAVSAER
jgi:hypothetical protein